MALLQCVLIDRFNIHTKNYQNIIPYQSTTPRMFSTFFSSCQASKAYFMCSAWFLQVVGLQKHTFG